MLKLVSSGLFGLDFFGAGLLSSELRKLSKIKIRCTIIFENIPQIIIQIIYLRLEGFQMVTVLALSASLLSVAATLIIYWGEKDLSNEYIVSKYFIKLSGTSLSRDKPKAALESMMKRRKWLRTRLTQIFGAGEKQIEIGSIKVQNDGVVLHVQHLIFEKELEKHRRNTDRYHVPVDDYVRFLFEPKISSIFEMIL